MNKIIFKILWKLWGNEKRIKYRRKCGAVIGENCDISRNVQFGTEPYLITIGNNVRLTNNVHFVTHDGSMWVLRNNGMVSADANIYGKIKIGNNVNVGWNTVIMPGVTIGNNCIIGLGSIVTRDIPDNMVAAGVPARVICTIEEYKNKHYNDIIYTKNYKGNEKRKLIIDSLK